MRFGPVAAVLLLALVAGCASSVKDTPERYSEGHIQPAEQQGSDSASAAIPELVSVAPTLPEPQPVSGESSHTVIVYDVPVSELLFSLARDSNLNLDIDSSIDAMISLNAVEQPLSALLDRIADGAGLRYRVQNNVLRVEMDTPFIRNYQVDYLNIARTSIGNVAVSTQISSTGQGASSDGGGGDSEAGNGSDTLVTNLSENSFWETLRSNIGDILNTSVAAEGEAEVSNPNVIMNRESGTIGVRATERQHGDVQRFLDLIQVASQRQVLIEATIAEVTLNDSYQAGIDWALINPDGSSGVTVGQALTSVTLQSTPSFNLSVNDLDFSSGNQLQATLRSLETFGKVSVMSSPKVMALNNQTALLKVVDNLVYFTVEVNIDTSSSGVGGGSLTTFETEINTVPVGFVMSVTPFIDENQSVILNVRPTISRVIDFVQDPNPQLTQEGVVSQIPVIQVREVESILKVGSGAVAIIGGLMQDEIKKNETGVPFLNRLPFIGGAFEYDNDESTKTELVIFLKPTVIENASLGGDLRDFNQYLPNAVN